MLRTHIGRGKEHERLNIHPHLIHTFLIPVSSTIRSSTFMPFFSQCASSGTCSFVVVVWYRKKSFHAHSKECIIRAESEWWEERKNSFILSSLCIDDRHFSSFLFMFNFSIEKFFLSLSTRNERT